MLKIRLQRVGRKREPVFRLVLVDSHSGPKTGKLIEILGSYDPRRNEESVIKEDRVKHWLSHGAKTSDTVFNLLVSKKVLEGKKINVLPKKSPIKKEGEEESKKEEAKVEDSTDASDKESEKVESSSETPDAEAKSVEEEKPAESSGASESSAEDSEPKEKPEETVAQDEKVNPENEIGEEKADESPEEKKEG